MKILFDNMDCDRYFHEAEQYLMHEHEICNPKIEDVWQCAHNMEVFDLESTIAELCGIIENGEQFLIVETEEDVKIPYIVNEIYLWDMINGDWDYKKISVDEDNAIINFELTKGNTINYIDVIMIS